MMNLLFIAMGGALGAVARYGCHIGAELVWKESFPIGIILVNVLGSFVMGLIFAMGDNIVPVSSAMRPLVITGFLGAFTTFSAFSLDAVMLLQRGLMVQALLYILCSVVFSITALWIGMMVVKIIHEGGF